MSKKMIIELSDEQHENLVNYAKMNNSNKTEVVRLFCDLLSGLFIEDINIIAYDKYNVKMISIVKSSKEEEQALILVDPRTRRDIKKLESTIIYESGKQLFTNCKIKREEIRTYGGELHV